jgi:L-alanine-DL-glutamate epimerase-like enolase superfamily enzyme
MSIDPRHSGRFQIVSVAAEPLSVPLIEPFVISSGRVDVTQSVLVTAEVLDHETSARAEGLGEGAALPPVTRETQKDALFSVLSASSPLPGFEFPGGVFEALHRRLTELLPSAPVARAALQTAVLDAVARLEGKPLWRVFHPDPTMAPRDLLTDITLPIGDPGHMAALAEDWWKRGFRSFKVKVGRDLEQDIDALKAIHDRAPAATFRLDANAAYAVTDALALIRAAASTGIIVECFEQPCGRLALEAMAKVAAGIEPPVIADESVSTLDDLNHVVHLQAADGVNLKIAKSGGWLDAWAIGRTARRAGLSLMVGGMVETRLGATAAAHLATALGGVEFPDLDTPWLLQDDPFRGGYTAEGPRMVLTNEPGLGVRRK